MSIRRLPIYILFDTNGFISGKPIATVENAVKALETELFQDPYALETAYLSVIKFDSSTLGDALSLLAQKIETEVKKTSIEHPGDWNPLVFIFTSGQLTDNLQNELADFKKCEVGIVIACVIGSDANVSVLKQITEIVVQLNAADPASMKEFFQWALSCWKESTQEEYLDKKNKQMKEITIGSSPQCDIIIEKDYILPIHCKIVKDEQGFRLICFGKWIQVNGNMISLGEKVVELMLHINDIVSINLDIINWLQYFYNCPNYINGRLSTKWCVECYCYEAGEPHFCGEYDIYHYGQLFKNRKR